MQVFGGKLRRRETVNRFVCQQKIDRLIAVQMGRYWGNFARTGDPNTLVRKQHVADTSSSRSNATRGDLRREN